MTLLVIDAGGTIGSVASDDGRLRPGRFRPGSALVNRIANMMGLPVAIEPLTDESGAIAPPLDSAAWGPRQWKCLTAMIDQRSAQHDGVVILHGTDTLCHTAAALLLALRRPHPPVILTGAMLPPGDPASDAPENVRLALIAAEGRLGCLENQVGIAVAGQVIHGAYAVKHAATGHAAFSSPRMLIIRTGQTSSRQAKIISRWQEGNFPDEWQPNASFSTEVFDIGLGPTSQHGMLFDAIEASGAKAVLFRCYASGIAPTDARLGDLADRLMEAGVLSIAVSSARTGKPGWQCYGLGRELEDSALINGMTLSPEAAHVLLSWALGNGLTRMQIADAARRHTVAAR